MIGSATLWRSRLLAQVELPSHTDHGVGGTVTEVRARSSFWLFRVIDFFTGAPSGDSQLVLLVLDSHVVPLKRVYSSYDLEVAVKAVTEMMKAGDLAGIAKKYKQPQLWCLIDAP